MTTTLFFYIINFIVTKAGFKYILTMVMKMENDVKNEKLTPCFGQMSIWAYSIGTSIGWGSLVVTCNTYLAQAGVMGTVLGLVVGMLVTFVITQNLQYMIRRNQDAGGIYKFAQKVCGHDFGFLAAWFLLLTYISILWANITSVPLFARYFLGDVFQFGFHYHIFGYEVYFGETLLSIAAICLAGLLCVHCRKGTNGIMVVSAITFVAGFTFCTIWALIHHGQGNFSFEPLYLPDSAAVIQISRIAIMSPWAFIGFENISHFSEEYTFKVDKVRKILYTSVILSTLVYVFVTLLSVTAYPPEYASWIEYISDMGNLTGFKAVPAFYAINYYLGNTGVAILMFALFGAIVTSLLGNTMALSRLMYAAGRDGGAPSWLKKRNKQGNPVYAISAVVLLSVLIPFLGRTAIGWIVDITTLGATIIYGLASYAVYKDAQQNNIRVERTTGMVGLILMLTFALMLLLPHLFSFSSMASESYILFDLWAVLGLVYFRRLVVTDKNRQYGRSVLVWFMLLLFVLFASMMWVSEATQKVTGGVIDEIGNYYNSTQALSGDSIYLMEQSHKIHNINALFTVASFAVFIVFALIILSNFKIMKKREEEHSKQLDLAEQRAATDQLTGVKNRHAYYLKELELNEKIDNNEIDSFAIVVCDINDLKLVNDNKGHNLGDQCICCSCKLICSIFKRSPVFRIGGDEFVVILEGDDYENRFELMEQIGRKTMECKEKVGSTIASGISEFVKGKDKFVSEVFARADSMMYEKKNQMKC